MLGRVAQTVRRAARGEFWIANKFHDRRGERPSVTRFDEQTILAMLNDLRNIAYFRSDDGTAAGESFPQDDWRRLGAQGSYHHHVACRINVGGVPTISCHYD